MQAMKFMIVGGIFGETVELLRLGSVATAISTWRLAILLFFLYALIAGTAYAAAGLLLRRQPERRLVWASVSFATILLVPWLNFDYLPALESGTSLLGNALLMAAIIMAGRLAIRWAGLATLAILLLALTVNGRAAIPDGVATREQPRDALGRNVILLVLDTLRADHLGTYGYDRPTSPELDRLAREGVVFEHAVSQAPWTKPSVASLLTGKYAHEHGVRTEHDALSADVGNMARELRRHGFRTAAFTSNPWVTPEFGFDNGFDHFFQSARMSGVQMTLAFGLVSRLEMRLRQVGVSIDLTDLLRSPIEHYPTNVERDRRLTDEMLRWLDEHHSERFFVYAHLIGPHTPYRPPEEYASRFRDPSWDPESIPTIPPRRARSIFSRAHPLDETSLQMLIAQYDAAIAFTDSLVGEIRRGLERLNVLDDSILIVTSDHGEEFYEHGSWTHWHSLYDEATHVPLIMRLPSVLQPSRRKEPVMLVDVYPTVGGLLGIDLAGKRLDGENLFGTSVVSRSVVYSEYAHYLGGSYRSRMALQGSLKLIETVDEARNESLDELYDHGSDPAEKRNLLKHPTAGVAHGAAGLRIALADFGSVELARAPKVRLDSATEEQLRRLGYADDKH
jgi:arylsulfatase A-like enzyme